MFRVQAETESDYEECNTKVRSGGPIHLPKAPADTAVSRQDEDTRPSLSEPL